MRSRIFSEPWEQIKTAYASRIGLREIALKPGTLCFECNVCGQKCLTDVRTLSREEGHCDACGSFPRLRAIIAVLSRALFGATLTIPEFPERKTITGLGMSDLKSYATRLATKFNYQNTHYHKAPRLDISTDNLPSELEGHHDFVISGDVFEHVRPPIARAFENVWKLLKPGGIFILTVPYGLGRDTVEHFPDLHQFTVVQTNGEYRLRNITREGLVQEFDNLVFHKSPGLALEMRIFSESTLINHLKQAGFADIKVHRHADLVHGIWWPEPWSLPISSRKRGSPAP